MEPFDTRQSHQALDTREDLERMITLFYTKYIPEGDTGNLSMLTQRVLTPDELNDLRFREGALTVKLAARKGGVTRIDLLRAQIGDTIRAYAEGFRVTNKMIPDVMRSRIDADIDSFYKGTVNELYIAVRSGLIQGRPSKWQMEAVSGVFNKQAKKLGAKVNVHYEHMQSYLLLKGYEMAGYDRFKFIVEQTDTTCETCLSHAGAVYTSDKLAVAGAFPPLHPHCKCHLVTMDGILVRSDGLTDGSIPLTNINERPKPWYEPLLRIPQDAGDMWNAFMDAQLNRYHNIDKGVLEFLDWFTYGIFSGIINANAARTDEAQEDPNLYTISNWATLGTSGVFVDAVSPDEPLSLEHWLNSLGAASVILSGYNAVQKSIAISEPPKLPDRIVEVPKGAFESRGKVVEPPKHGSLDDISARKWYLEAESKIPDMIDRTKPLEQQAKQAFGLRNQFRDHARNAMSNRPVAESLYLSDPNMTWDQIVSKYSSKGYTGDSLWNEIIRASTRSRSSVNKGLGLE